MDSSNQLVSFYYIFRPFLIGIKAKEKCEATFRSVKGLDPSGLIDLHKLDSSSPKHEGGFGKVYIMPSESGKLAVKLISVCYMNPDDSNVCLCQALMPLCTELPRPNYDFF